MILPPTYHIDETESRLSSRSAREAASTPFHVRFREIEMEDPSRSFTTILSRIPEELWPQPVDLEAAAQLPSAPTNPPKLPHQRRTRKPSIDRLIAQAERRSGKHVTSATLPDGTTLRFDEPKPEPTEANNPWLAAVPGGKR